MRTPSTTRISSRGQIVIPGPVRKALAIEPGTAFLVIARKDTVGLRRRGLGKTELSGGPLGITCSASRSYSFETRE